MSEGESNNILRVIVDNMLYPVTLDTLHMVRDISCYFAIDITSVWKIALKVKNVGKFWGKLR